MSLEFGDFNFFDIDAATDKSIPRGGGGRGYFLVKDYWGCAAGWSRIFTARLTIMGLHL